MMILRQKSVAYLIALFCSPFLIVGYLCDPFAGKPLEHSQDIEISQGQVANEPSPKEQLPYVVDKTLPELLVANKSTLLDREYEPSDLRSVNGVYLRDMAATALTKMLEDAEKKGIDGLVVYSGYRSYHTQAAVYDNKIASLRSEYGDKAKMMAEQLVAPPGASEHQTGLAVDFTIQKFLHKKYVLNYDFADTIQGQWLRNNAWKYGYILRYDESKEDITQISYEPWHFRYVGVEHATRMYERNLCLEEYVGPPIIEKK